MHLQNHLGDSPIVTMLEQPMKTFGNFLGPGAKEPHTSSEVDANRVWTLHCIRELKSFPWLGLETACWL